MDNLTLAGRALLRRAVGMLKRELSNEEIIAEVRRLL